MSKILMIVNAVPCNQGTEALKEYSAGASAIFKDNGAQPIAKHLISETLIGEGNTKLVSMTEFPSKEAIQKAFESPEYKALIPLRDKAFASLDVFLSEQ